MKLKAFLKKEKQLICYLLFGLITTVVSLLAWYLTLHYGVAIWADENGDPTPFLDILGSTSQWVSGVLVSFVTSKLWVFTEADKGWRVSLRQFTAFISSRLLTYFLEVVINLGAIEALESLNCPSFTLNVFSHGFDVDARLWAKVISSVIIVFTNYFISKIFVFRIKRKDPKRKAK